jgi:fructuronate reductase
LIAFSASYQIAMDGTEKLPQRILAPALDARDKGLDVRPFAFATSIRLLFV